MKNLPTETTPAQRTRTLMGLPVSAVAFLVLTAAISLVLSHYRLMWFDEYLGLNTDSVSSMSEMVHVQRTAPIVLDPIAYHLAAHIAIRLFGVGVFALRLPSLLGYLLMQLCLFLFVRRISSERAALFAMVFPSLLYAQYFAVDGRPYGMLLGLYALVLLCWQSAARDIQRTPALITLAIALAITLNTHYFAPLLLLPLYAAELFRTMQRRKFDLPMLASIGAGSAGIVFILPFVKAAAEYREHYIALNVNAQFIPLAYHSLLIFPDGSSSIGRTVFLIVLALSLIWSCVHLFLHHPVKKMLRSEYVLISMLATLPFFGYLLARFVTHSIYARYVLATTLGIAILEAVAFAPLLRSRRATRILFSLMLLIILGHGAQRIRRERQLKQQRLATLAFTPAIKSAILNSPDGLLYIQDLETFFFARLYESDPQMHSRLALVASQEEEMRIMHQNTYWLQGTHAGTFTDARVVPYESVAARPGEHVFVALHNRYQWLDSAFASSHATTQYLGPAFGSLDPTFDGDFEAVSFPRAGGIE